jgi:hypothetical protein
MFLRTVKKFSKSNIFSKKNGAILTQATSGFAFKNKSLFRLNNKKLPNPAFGWSLDLVINSNDDDG